MVSSGPRHCPGRVLVRTCTLPGYRLLPAERNPVAVRVGEVHVPGPIRVDDRLLLHELHAETTQTVEVALEVGRVDDAVAGDLARLCVCLAWRAGPEDDLQVLVFEPDGDELDPAGRVLLTLLEAERVDVEVE